MTNPPIISNPTVKDSPTNPDKPVPSSYPESVRMTGSRLANAVIKATRQGGSSEH